ncbi:MAG TPA: class I SAM-dependent methyltransferase [Pyrinomonadaceae bacterium]|nr:class I SAM-dependent methyltransferase [Pyrinomonadaceae bacterium]
MTAFAHGGLTPRCFSNGPLFDDVLTSRGDPSADRSAPSKSGHYPLSAHSPLCYPAIDFRMSESNFQLKERVRAFWQANPCGIKFADAEPGSRKFFELVEQHRYETEWHIPDAADFASAKGLRVLEIGCGMGTDGAEFAKAGADYTGVDLTEAAVDLARKRFEAFNLQGTFRSADAENLDFPDESFDLVYSHGVLHHTPDTAGAVREVHRVLRKGGRAVVMLYHRNSYNYRVNIRLLRRGGAHLLKWKAGRRLINVLTGEPMESLKEHADKLRDSRNGSPSDDEFLNQNTDGAGNPLARVYSRDEALALFKDFAEVKFRVFFLNKRFIPLVGSLLPRSVEASMASRWGWHLWIYAKK